MSIQQASLYYKDGSSDKVYHAQIEEKDGGYVVNFQYGRRGSTLTAGTKTKDPIDLAKATKTYTALIKEKMGKGYTEGESGAVFQSSLTEERVTGIVPQLLNNVKSDEELEELFRSDDWMMEEKFDGRRLMVKNDKEVTGINKKGLAIITTENIASLVSSAANQIVTDGEVIGDFYHIFDILELNGENLRDKTAFERYQILAGIPQFSENVVKVYLTEQEKREAFARIKAEKGEGVVFKLKKSNYVSGRPASGGNQRKYKFWESATVKVIKQHKTKRSVTVAVYDNGKERDIGNVTIPANYDIPEVGSIVEVIYLYCHLGDEGKLYQTKYKGVRDDQDISDCKLSQIKFKSESGDEEDEE